MCSATSALSSGEWEEKAEAENDEDSDEKKKKNTFKLKQNAYTIDFVTYMHNF